MKQKKSANRTVKSKAEKLSPLDEAAAKAPPRGKLTQKQLAEVVKLLGQYKVVDDQLEAIDSRVSSLLTEREKLAHRIVRRWGKGLLVFAPVSGKPIHYMPASNHGRIVLRRLPMIQEWL